MLFKTLFRFGETHMTNIKELLKIAKAEINRVNPGEIILLGHLLKGYGWNSVSRIYRLLLGILFLNFIINRNSRVKIIEKTPSNKINKD